MSKACNLFGILFNIGSFALLLLSAIQEAPDEAFGVSLAFAFWAYSVIFALIAMLLYSIGAFKAFKSGESIFRLLFTVAVFALCITVGGALNGNAILIWNVVFAINLILQIRWFIKS